MKKIDLEVVMKQFKLIDGVLYKDYSRGGSNSIWRSVKHDGISEQYKHVSIHGSSYQLHRIVWAISNGRDTDKLIDHIDGDITNNHPSNLREATDYENARNNEKVRQGKMANVSNCKQTGKLSCYLSIKGKKIQLARLCSEEECQKALEVAYKIQDSFCGDVNKFRLRVQELSGVALINEAKGYSFCNRTKKWDARVRVNNKALSIGLFKTAEEAKKARDIATKSIHSFQNPKQFRELVKSLIKS